MYKKQQFVFFCLLLEKQKTHTQKVCVLRFNDDLFLKFTLFLKILFELKKLAFCKRVKSAGGGTFDKRLEIVNKL